MKQSHISLREIDKADKDVLLSDFTRWHFPFSYHGFIGSDQAEAEAFEKMLEEKQLDRKSFLMLPRYIQKKIIVSWDRVLDMNFDPYHTSPERNQGYSGYFLVVVHCWNRESGRISGALDGKKPLR